MVSYKVALCTDWYIQRPGGVAAHVHELAKVLNELGIDVTVITNKEYKEKEFENEIETIAVEGMTDPIFDVNISPSTKKKLEPILDDFDIVHGHHAFTPLSLRSVGVASDLGKGTVVTNHSLKYKPDSFVWQALGDSTPFVPTYLQKADRIIAVSEASKKFISHFTDNETVVIPNGVDDKRYIPEGPSREFGENTLLFVGRLISRKGVHVLLNAFDSLLDHKDAELVIVGKGSMEKFLKIQAKILGINEKVHFLGYVPEKDLPEIFRGSDVFVMPSTGSEAFGIVALEAMASGVPVVGSKVGGIPDIVEGNGVLFDPDDEDDIVDSILKVLNNPELADELAKNGRERVENNFSWDIIGKRVIDFYEEILESKS